MRQRQTNNSNIPITLPGIISPIAHERMFPNTRNNRIIKKPNTIFVFFLRAQNYNKSTIHTSKKPILPSMAAKGNPDSKRQRLIAAHAPHTPVVPNP